MSRLRTLTERSAGYGAAWFVGMNATVLLRKHQNPNVKGWTEDGNMLSVKSLAASSSYCLGIGSVVASARALGAPVWVATLSGLVTTLVAGKLIATAQGATCPIPNPDMPMR